MQENLLVEDRKSWKRLVLSTIIALILALVAVIGISAWDPPKAHAASPTVQLSAGARYGVNVYTNRNCTGTRQFLSAFQRWTRGVHVWRSTMVPGHVKTTIIDTGGVKTYHSMSYAHCVPFTRLYAPLTWITNSYQQ
jgi:hypothetical protein